MLVMNSLILLMFVSSYTADRVAFRGLTVATGQPGADAIRHAAAPFVPSVSDTPRRLAFSAFGAQDYYPANRFVLETTA